MPAYFARIRSFSYIGIGYFSFFDAPVVNRDWRVASVDPELVRFGLQWKLYDLIAEKGLDFRVPILESKPGNWLLGGTSGTLV